MPTAAILATRGHDIIGVDISEKARRDLIEGDPYSEEPGLYGLLEDARNSGRLSVSESPRTADVFMICVPTPFKADKKADLGYIMNACNSLVPHLKKGDLVILESTVPPTTTREVVCSTIEEAGLSVTEDVQVAFCPERVMPGKLVKELVENDRVIGGIDEASGLAAKEVYASFCTGRLFITDATTAEFVKLIENSFRDINIAFANELAIVSKDIGIDIWEAIELANMHPRVNIHNPGPGVGGHCIAVDPYFIIERANGKASFLSLARERNSQMPSYVIEQTEKLLGGLEGKKITLLGLAYKGDIGDPRESPALDIIALLKVRGVECSVFDPHVEKGMIPELASLDDSIKDADLLIITTDHSSFRELDPEHIGSLVKSKMVFDTRHFIDRKIWESTGWNVSVIGDGK